MTTRIRTRPTLWFYLTLAACGLVAALVGWRVPWHSHWRSAVRGFVIGFGITWFAGMLGLPFWKRKQVFVLPTHCEACGAVLCGGATVHKPDCPIRKLIEELLA